MIEAVDARKQPAMPRGTTRVPHQRAKDPDAGAGTAIAAGRRPALKLPGMTTQAVRTAQPPNQFVCQRRRKSTWPRG
jgi:hypothetical protein